MHPLHRKRHRRRREEAAAGQIRQNFFGSRKNSRSVFRDSRNWGGKTEETKREKRQRRKEGRRRKLPARKRFGKDFPKGKIGKSRQQKIHPGGTMQQQKEGGGPFNEGKGADLKGQSGNQTQCAHQRAEDLGVEPQPSHGKTGIRGRGLFRRFKGSFDRRALIGNVYAKFLFL